VFDEGLLDIIRRADFTVTAVVIDKKKHIEQYLSPFHPYHYCLAALLDRYSGWLNLFNRTGDVMAESRGRNEDLQLQQAYRRVYESGTLFFEPEHHQRALTSRDLKLKSKQDSVPGLQLADVLAHPVKQDILIRRKIIDDPGAVFGKRLIEIVEDKFNRHYSLKRIDGYGRVWL